MTLLGELIFVAQAIKLKTGVIAEVVHTTQLSSLSAIVRAASISGARIVAQDVLHTAHIAL